MGSGSLTKSRLYNTWRGMKERCTNPNHKNYNLYKGKLCLEWLDSATFCEWAELNGYEEGLTIDRVEPLKGYSPSNCQFITARENTAKGNRERKVTVVNFEGNTYTLTELSKVLGLKVSTLSWRIKHNKVLTAPLK